MSSGKEFQRTDAATGNERCPTVDRRKGVTWNSRVDLQFCARITAKPTNQAISHRITTYYTYIPYITIG